MDLTLVMTHKCNMSCSYCYDSINRSIQRSLSPTESESIIKMAVDQFGDISVTYHGGEPTILGFKYWKELFNKTSHIQISNGQALRTNGFSVSDKMILLFKQNNLDVNISYDAGIECGVRNKTIEKFIQKLIFSLGKQHVIISCSLSLNNLDKIPKAYEIIYSLGARLIGFAIIEDKSLSQSLKQSGKLIESMIPLLDYMVESEYDADVRPLDGLISNAMGCCTTSSQPSCQETNITVDCNGDIYPCNVLIGRVQPIGNVFNDKGFNQALNHPFRAEIIEISNKRNDKCGDCEFTGYCLPGCPIETILSKKIDESIDRSFKCEKQELIEFANCIQFRMGTLNHKEICDVCK
jgi:radical SAM protein with 4Fe4S-binding SPASM domain